MSVTSGTVNNPAIDNLVQFSLESENLNLRLKWIPYEEITNIKPTQIDNVYYVLDNVLVLLGSSEECTPAIVNNFARIYSLPTHKYNHDVSEFRRHSNWLTNRNKFIKGFTKFDGNYYMVADKRFYHCYSRYGFCSACGILRCSPVWCICGRKELSDGWTSNNKKLDELINESQLQTSSANDAYLEWIPSDCINDRGYGSAYFYGLPTINDSGKLIPLEITNETHDLYYDKLCDNHPDILATDVWDIIGFTYDASEHKYCLIKDKYGHKLCLACTCSLNPKINAFCYECKAPQPVDWTTGNKSLDSFIMESWSNIKHEYDAYIQWIEHSLLINVQEMASLRHGSTHIACLVTNELTHVTLKKIVNEQNKDFHQLTKEYPEILTPENILIIGITRKPSSREYYLVFYHEIRPILDRILQRYDSVRYMPYSDFDELKEIGSGGYGSVYTAKYKNYSEIRNMQETVVLKRFKGFDKTPELFFSEFLNAAKCVSRDYYYPFLEIYGVTQNPETKEYIIVMQHANNGSLSSYLNQNINKLTWRMKLECLRDIARYLYTIHNAGLVHCDLHGGNIIMHDERRVGSGAPFICDLGLSRSVDSRQQNSTVRGVLPFIAPELFHTRKYTQESDVYSFGIIMYLIATGEPPFRGRQFDTDLVCDIVGGLRPSMPDSAPEEYKKLAERCCDADPDKRSDAYTLWRDIDKLIDEVDNNNSVSDTWNAIYQNDVKPLSRLEKESKYSSTLLPTGDLFKSKSNSQQLPPLSDFSLPSLEAELGKVDEE